MINNSQMYKCFPESERSKRIRNENRFAYVFHYRFFFSTTFLSDHLFPRTL